MEEEELDVRGLQGKQEKIKELMRRDPKFIARLISVSLSSHLRLETLLHQLPE